MGLRWGGQHEAGGSGGGSDAAQDGFLHGGFPLLCGCGDESLPMCHEPAQEARRAVTPKWASDQRFLRSGIACAGNRRKYKEMSSI
jgi:hypothetical protein